MIAFALPFAFVGAVLRRDWRLSEIVAVLSGPPQETPGNFVMYCVHGCGRRAITAVPDEADESTGVDGDWQVRGAVCVECLHRPYGRV